jgi:hypothetical protein
MKQRDAGRLKAQSSRQKRLEAHFNCESRNDRGAEGGECGIRNVESSMPKHRQIAWRR